MKKYSAAFILLEIAIMAVIGILPAVPVLFTPRPEFAVLIVLMVWSIELMVFAECANKILFPRAQKTMDQHLAQEGFVSSHTFQNREKFSCGSILVIDEVHGRIAYVSVHNPFAVQTADVRELFDIRSGYTGNPFGGTRYVYYRFRYRNNRTMIPTFTAKNGRFVTDAKVQQAIAKADSFRDTILALQKRLNSQTQ